MKWVPVMLALAGCTSSSPEGAADAAASSEPAVQHPVAQGAAAIIADNRLIVAGVGGLTHASLPVESVSVHPLGGPAAQLVRTRDRLLVTVSEPSALHILKPDLATIATVSLPSGAFGVAVLPSGDALVTSTDAAKISLVDVAGARVRWSKDTPRLPRQVLLNEGGESALITHRISMGPSRVTPNPSWADGASVKSASGTSVRVDEWVVSTPNGIVRTQAPARAVTARASSGAILEATDDALVERIGSEHRGRATHRCRNPGGIAIAPADDKAFLSCGDGRVAVLSLPLDERTPVAYFGGAGDADRCVGVEVPEGKISKTFGGANYLTAKRVEETLLRYHCRYPARTRLISIATTHEQRNVWSIVIGRDLAAHDRATIFLNGGHHGDELMATTFAMDAVAALLEDNVATGAFEDVVFAIAPLVNPDGNYHRFADALGRKNGRDNDGDGTREPDEGVDLNRNYPFRWGALGEAGSSTNPGHKWFRGPSAASEPETRGVMRLAASEKFAASMSFHTGALSLCASYTIPRVKNPEPDAAWLVGWDIVTNIPPHPEGGVPVQRRLYPLDGNDQDWLRHTHGTLSFLWEGGEAWVSHAPRRFRASARGAWIALAKRFARGPTVSVRVRDAAGRPLVAQVSVAEIKHHEGERWHSRCRDGRFDYILPRPGDYTVVVQRGDKRTERKVSVGKGQHPIIEVELPVLIERPAVCPTPTRDAGKPASVLQLR